MMKRSNEWHRKTQNFHAIINNRNNSYGENFSIGHIGHICVRCCKCQTAFSEENMQYFLERIMAVLFPEKPFEFIGMDLHVKLSRWKWRSIYFLSHKTVLWSNKGWFQSKDSCISPFGFFFFEKQFIPYDSSGNFVTDNSPISIKKSFKVTCVAFGTRLVTKNAYRG